MFQLKIINKHTHKSLTANVKDNIKLTNTKNQPDVVVVKAAYSSVVNLTRKNSTDLEITFKDGGILLIKAFFNGKKGKYRNEIVFDDDLLATPDAYWNENYLAHVEQGQATRFKHLKEIEPLLFAKAPGFSWLPYGGGAALLLALAGGGGSSSGDSGSNDTDNTLSPNPGNSGDSSSGSNNGNSNGNTVPPLPPVKPGKPEIDNNGNNGSLTGKGDPDNIIFIDIGGDGIPDASTIVKPDGTWEIPGFEIPGYDKDKGTDGNVWQKVPDGLESDKVEIFAGAPIINILNINENFISGDSNALDGSQVEVTINNNGKYEVLRTSVVNGQWQVATPSNVKNLSKVEAFVTDVQTNLKSLTDISQVDVQINAKISALSLVSSQNDNILTNSDAKDKNIKLKLKIDVDKFANNDLEKVILDVDIAGVKLSFILTDAQKADIIAGREVELDLGSFSKVIDLIKLTHNGSYDIKVDINIKDYGSNEFSQTNIASTDFEVKTSEVKLTIDTDFNAIGDTSNGIGRKTDNILNRNEFLQDGFKVDGSITEINSTIDKVVIQVLDGTKVVHSITANIIGDKWEVLIKGTEQWIKNLQDGKYTLRAIAEYEDLDNNLITQQDPTFIDNKVDKGFVVHMEHKTLQVASTLDMYYELPNHTKETIGEVFILINDKQGILSGNLHLTGGNELVEIRFELENTGVRGFKDVFTINENKSILHDNSNESLLNNKFSFNKNGGWTYGFDDTNGSFLSDLNADSDSYLKVTYQVQDNVGNVTDFTYLYKYEISSSTGDLRPPNPDYITQPGNVTPRTASLNLAELIFNGEPNDNDGNMSQYVDVSIQNNEDMHAFMSHY